jgi:mannose-6-phosphate isomerase-like protein (cupin superfamily)
MVLYIVSPSYVFEMDNTKRIVHDDAIMVAETWEELAENGYDMPALKITSYEARARRAEAERRLALLKGHGPEPLPSEEVRSLKDEYDYCAPDGSEIRLLVSGEHGGLAHCVLPAGNVSKPVRHRTVEELWYVLEGTGEIWRGRDNETRVDAVRGGDSIRIPVGTEFQFRAAQASDLKLLLTTMPPWPGPQEAVPARGGFTAVGEERSEHDR